MSRVPPSPKRRPDSPEVITGKMRSWILTGAAAAVMTAGSLPFVWDLLRSGLDVGAVQPRRMLSEGVVAFFMAYLQLVSGAVVA